MVITSIELRHAQPILPITDPQRHVGRSSLRSIITLPGFIGELGYISAVKGCAGGGGGKVGIECDGGATNVSDSVDVGCVVDRGKLRCVGAKLNALTYLQPSRAAHGNGVCTAGSGGGCAHAVISKLDICRVARIQPEFERAGEVPDIITFARIDAGA